MRRLLAACVFALCVLHPAWAEETSPLPDETGPDRLLASESIAAAIAELEAVKTPSPEEKAALGSYRAALNHLQAARRDEAEAARLKQLIDGARESKASLEAQLEQAERTQEVPPWVEEVLPAAELQQRLNQAQADAKVSQSQLADLEALLDGERQRWDQSAAGIASLKLELQNTESELKGLDGFVGQQDPVTAARQVELRAKRLAMRSRLASLDMERLSSDPRRELLKLRISLVSTQLERRTLDVQRLQNLVSAKRGAEALQASQEAEQAQREALGKHQLIQQAAARNAELGSQLEALTAQLDQVLRNKERVVANLGFMERRMARSIQQLDVSYADEYLGKMLREHRRELPNTRKLANRLEQTRRQLARTQLIEMQLEDRQQQLHREIDELPRSDYPAAGISSEQWALLQPELQTLLNDGSTLYGQLLSSYERLVKLLGELESAQSEQITTVNAYEALLSRHLLWTPSAQPMHSEIFTGSWGALGRVIFQGDWRDQGERTLASLTQQPLNSALLLLVVAAMLVARPRLRRLLEKIAPQVGNVTRDSFGLTFKALLASGVLAMPWVVLLIGVQLLLNVVPKQADAILISILWYVSMFFAMLQGWRYLFVPHGLAEVHFHWSSALIVSCRRSLGWFTAFSIPLLTLLFLAQREHDVVTRELVGRPIAMLWLLGTWILFERLLSPWWGAGIKKNSPSRRLNPWRLLAYLLAMGAMLFLAILEIRGYYHTVARLTVLVIFSLSTGLLVLLAYNLAARWLLVAERRLALSRAREKRQALQEVRAAKEAADAAGEVVLEPPELEEINLAMISGQTRRLLQALAMLALLVALFLLWAQLTPAFSRLDEVVLWTHVTTEGESQRLIEVSLWDLATNILVLLLMVIAGRNLPGLLEIAVLQHLKIDRGSRYAISRVSHYLIYGTGILIAFSVIGVGWSDIQWLVAAMGVGLGFGLQEIFANFISGLMILFERPIRIGDTVTVGNVTGSVTRIRMRATTITDWDNKELLIPNKTFVTDPLINWTLSDEVTRVVIPIGIAYGSDTEQAHKIMLDVVSAHPDAMDDPNPRVFFLGFGDSALNFEIQVFVRDRLTRLPLTHDLHMQLDRALREAGIEIPFPQRDLHLRSIDPGVDLGGGFGKPG